MNWKFKKKKKKKKKLKGYKENVVKKDYKVLKSNGKEGKRHENKSRKVKVGK